VRQAYIIQHNKVMAEGAELDMDEARAFRRTNGMRRVLARRPSASLGILDKDTEGDFLTVGRYSCDTAGVGPCELPTLNCY
jgi:hypothetical protein